MIGGSLNWWIRKSFFVAMRVLRKRQNASVFAEMRQVTADVGVQFGNLCIITATADRVRGRSSQEMVGIVMMMMMERNVIVVMMEIVARMVNRFEVMLMTVIVLCSEMIVT